MKKHFSCIIAMLLFVATANAQLAKDNPCKFLGNITTYNSVRSDFITYWNQITPENESKWGVIEGTRDKMNWSGCDAAYNYAKEHNIPFKFHTLIWGSQYPSWMDNLSQQEQYEEIVEWYDAVAERYPDLEYIDVVNEAIKGHAPAPYKNALGGDGSSGYDWIVKAFHLARERWPNAILIYNDYNTFQWQKNEFIDLVQRIVKAGAPIDAVGCQAHDLNDMGGSQFRSALEEIHNKTGLPVYITEYDICKADDQAQLNRYKEQFPIMWEADYVAGVTLWGYIFGATWVEDNGVKGASGLIKDGKDRPAMTWLKEYMQTSAAKNAVSPICGGKSKISATLTLSSESVIVGEEVQISVSASVKDGGRVDCVEIFAGEELLANKNTSPYECSFIPYEAGVVTIKIVVYDGEGKTLEKTAKLTVCSERRPYSGVKMELPGILELENFDEGCSGMAFSDSDDANEGEAYRNDCGVDIVEGNGGYAIGYTSTGEWLEYTINVKEAGNYSYVAYVASGSENSGFHISLKEGNKETDLTDKLVVTKGDDWDTYTTLEGELSKPLSEGEQIFRITIDGSYVNIDKIEFTCSDCEPEGTSLKLSLVSKEGVYDVYSTLGYFVARINCGAGESLNQKLHSVVNEPGVYVLKDVETGESKLCISKE